MKVIKPDFEARREEVKLDKSAEQFESELANAINKAIDNGIEPVFIVAVLHCHLTIMTKFVIGNASD